MPSRSAISTTRSAPTFSVSQAKYVFTERPNALHMVRGPSIDDGLAFAGHQRPSQLASPVTGKRVSNWVGATKSVDSGRPDSSAASMVKSLNVEPPWYPSIARRRRPTG